MSRLVGALDWAQRVGARIGAYKNIGWLAVLLTGFGVVAVKLALGRGAGLLISVAVLLVAAVLLTAAWIIYRRLSAMPYRWVAAEYVYRFEADDLRRQRQTIMVRIRARRNNVCCFENSYYWSGSGRSDVKVVSKGHRFVGEVPADDSKKLYWIHLDTPLDRGDEAEIHIEQSLFDAQWSLKPMLTKRVSSRLDELTLKAVFPQAAVPSEVKAREMTYSKKAPHWREVTMGQSAWRIENGMTEVSYKPPQLRRNRRYELNWDPWDIYSRTDKKP